MADKITLGSVGNIYNSLLTTINNNNALITTAFDNTLSRDGTTPNQMFATLDMNSFQVLNLPSPATVNFPARLVDVVTNPTITVPAVGTSGAVLDLLYSNSTETGNNTYSVTNILIIKGDNVKCGNNNTSSFSLGLLINQAFGGSNCFGGRIGLSSELTMTSPTAATNGVRFYAAVLGQGQANTSDGAAGGRMYGGNFLGVLTSGATSNFSQCSALYDQIFIQSGASVTTKTIQPLASGA